jgi:hypothetical protein
VKKEKKVNEIALRKKDFVFIAETSMEWGYKLNTKLDSSKTFERLQLSPPRKLPGREAILTYHNSNTGYTSRVPTSYLEAQEIWRKTGTDYFWIMITEADVEKYFTKPFKRPTKEEDVEKFVLEVLRYIWIAKWRVDHRWVCPKCSAFMDITRKKGTRQYYHACMRMNQHPDGKPVFLGWDYELPARAKEFVKIRRELSAKYRERNKKAGIIRKPAATIRKKWEIGKPENLRTVK